MSQGAFISRIISRLTAEGIPFMFAGSLASSAHGEPRGTQDIDVVIDPTPEQFDALVRSFGSDDRYYVSRTAAIEALKNRTMFNVIDVDTGWKADFILRKDRPFSREEFRRRVPGRVAGVDAIVVSPEDTILSKLEWAKESGSERQFRDAVGVAVVQFDSLDKAYLHQWAAELGVADALTRVLAEAESRRRPA